MKPLYKKYWLPVAMLLWWHSSLAQGPAFFHLSTAEGLSDNYVSSVTRDRNGILWMGTTEGLNSFDGYSITTYYKEQHPAIGDNRIYQVMSDFTNRIWIRTAANTIAMLDENRRFHAFSIDSNNTDQAAGTIIKTRCRGPIVLKGNKHYTWKDSSIPAFREFAWEGDTAVPEKIWSVSSLDDDKIMYCGNDRLVLVDYEKLEVLANIMLPGIESATRLNDREALAIAAPGNSIYRMNLVTNEITREYKNLRDQYGMALSNDLRSISPVTANSFVITTRFSGAYLFDVIKEKVERWQHHPVNNQSIGGNNTFATYYDTSGYLFITTRTSGVHFFNVKQPVAAHRPYFTNEQGNIFDGYIQTIASRDKSNLWLGAQDRLVKWNRLTNKSDFIDYRLPDGKSLNEKETIRALLFDRSGQLWLGTSRYGILILDSNNKTTGHFRKEKNSAGNTLSSNWINSLCLDSSGNIWAGTWQGLCKINPLTRQLTNFNQHPVLAPVSNLFTNVLWFDHAGNLWAGTNSGAWCYNSRQNVLTQYTTASGLTNDRILSFNEDLEHNIYIGTLYGLTVIKKDGSIKKYDRTNGLRNDKCEGILRDDEGFMWIGNHNCILRFNPSTEKFAVYEEGAGFSHTGFRMRCCYKEAEGELFWGSDKGVHYFFPEQLNNIVTTLHPSVNALRAGDSLIRFTAFNNICFAPAPVNYTFHFSSGELTGTRKIQFMYRLAGYEENWSKPASYNQATYNHLPSGQYRFELKASQDGQTWFNAAYPVSVTILNPWWKQWWFITICTILLAALAAVILYYRQKKRAAATIQKMIDYFAHSRYDHFSTNEILWDIARNCIGSLGFEDCVIYLADEEKHMLVQKAAYGPKSPSSYEIMNPLEIPIGKGIVGHVASTGKATIVNDTSKDIRYIVDDCRRLSEIAVPLVHEGKVIGIIDSEHTRRNFFTRQHLRALLTIASLCSAKISRAMAVEAMKKSQLELMELNVKMMESKFLNLRLQMNPHFLFNSLSSIQNLIVSQQTTRAYKYLTLFSNFLRSLLNHAEKNFITLDEELAIINMYIRLESLRFDQSFQYDIRVDETLSNEEILVPSLMVQPFVENAIWHGLMHKQGDKKLDIKFTNNNDEFLTCVIEDNGIGRNRSQAIREKKIAARVHESKGIKIVEERLQLLQQKTGKPATVEILDIYHASQEPAGTKIIITIPYYNPEV